MKEPHREGVAHRPDPESCVGVPQGRRRSVDRGTRRPGIELRNHEIRDADVVDGSGRQHWGWRYAQATTRSRAVEDPVYAWKLLARKAGDPTDAR